MRLRGATTGGGKSNLGLDRRKKSPSALADILTPIRGLTTHYTSDRITAHITVKTNRRHWHRAANQKDRDKWTEYNAKKSVVNLDQRHFVWSWSQKRYFNDDGYFVMVSNYYWNSEHSCYLSADDSTSTCVHGPATSDYFSSLCIVTLCDIIIVTTFNITSASAESTSEGIDAIQMFNYIALMWEHTRLSHSLLLGGCRLSRLKLMLKHFMSRTVRHWRGNSDLTRIPAFFIMVDARKSKSNSRLKPDHQFSFNISVACSNKVFLLKSSCFFRFSDDIS